MFTFIKQKLLYKKWLNICLFVGIILLVAVAACLPMYQNMSENQAFQNEMKQYIQDNGTYPCVVSVFQGNTYKKTKESFSKVIETIEGWDGILQRDLQMEPAQRIGLYTLKESAIIPIVNVAKRKNDKYLKISYMSDMEEHWKLIASEKEEAGKIPCYVSASALENNELYVGQTIEMKDYTDAKGNPLQLMITGVFEEKKSDDIYWVQAPEEYQKNVFVSEQDLEKIMTAQKQITVRFYAYYLYDYTKMKAKDISSYYKVLKRYAKAGFDGQRVEITTVFTQLLEDSIQQSKKIAAILWVLELPILALILIFIYMIASQILELEGNEIAMLKSRGVSMRQILWVYFCQASVLACSGIVLGIPLGYAICRLMGQSNAFLEFVNRKNLMAAITGKSVGFAIAGAVLAIAFMTLPLVKRANIDIVAKKSKRDASETAFFEKYYIDVVLLLVSGYSYYSFNKQKEEIAQRVLNGKGLDPVLFISAVLFMAGAGMIILRLFRVVVQLIYHMGKERWAPAVYASFLQILRTRRKQTFISLFLVVSIAMGIFYSNVARTINRNEEERIRYDTGADLVVKEKWMTMSKTYRSGDKQITDLVYVEPDTNLFEKVRKHTESAAEVLQRDVSLAAAKGLSDNGVLMAIQTEDFGNTAWMRDGLLDKHWYHYLNDLADGAGNILVSSNARERFNLKVGDTIRYSMLSEDNSYQDTLGDLTGKICGFVDAWPGFTGYKMVTDDNGNIKQEETYLIVANYGYVTNIFGIQPTEIWMKTGGHQNKVLDVIRDSGAVLEYRKDVEQKLILAKQTAMIQITNGMLTLSFLVVMILCMIGFLIYWITSIRQRELLFGIYRAMGMSMREIIQMLINEQICCSMIAVLSGVVSGMITSRLFIALITIAYAPEQHVLPYQLYISAGDMLRIGIIVLCMLGGGIYVLAHILAHMKIAQAIKMGED